MTNPTDALPNPVLVVGGGIAGMAASLHLAHLGLPVCLLDSAPAIGGSMHLLDHTFPTNSCGLCLMLPQQPAFCPTFECDLDPHLRLMPYTELVSLEGEPGAFSATVRHKPRFVDPALCTGCGLCAPVCPEVRPHDHEGLLAPTRAIYRPAGQRAVPDTWLIDPEVCTRCGKCVEACPSGAIDLEAVATEETISPAAVLLTPGFAPFDARLKGEYGYRVYDNVLSSLEFERMVSLAGSSVAHMARPSDGKPPRKVGFVHCVGSRDLLCGAGHCSSACCMYTAKQVALAKELDPDLEVTVFFMDLRAFGKDFEAYIDAVQALPGVTYRRSMPSSVHEVHRTGALRVSYAGPDGALQEEDLDLLVLAIGFAPPPGFQELGRSLGLDLNDYGFARTDGYHPTRTNRPGLFVAGAFREPKDIPETVAEAAAAAGEVAAFVQNSSPASAAQSLAVRDVSEEEVRTGVFYCACHGELDGLNLPALVERARGLPGVEHAGLLPAACEPEGLEALAQAIEGAALNRVVLAGCSHRLYADRFDDLMRRTGLDPRLLARVNLRDQVAYPHAGAPDRTDKAFSLVAMAAASLRALSGLDALGLTTHQSLTQRVLVVGGGAAGLSAARQLARLGLPVHLVEREERLGGQWTHIRYQVDGSDPQAALRDLLDGVDHTEGLSLHLQTQLTALEGAPGRYRATVTGPEGEQTLEVGAVVIATGGQPAPTSEYLYGQDPRVLTQRELEQQIAEGTLAHAQRVVMIQCVGSREPGRPYCSRVCCTQAVKNALRLKELRPDLNLYVLYRDVRTYGFREAAYQEARDAGVVFLRYELPHKPQVAAHAQGLSVSLTDPVSRLSLELNADLLVLSTGIEPGDQESMATTLDVPLNADGFFQEEHPKMKPLDLARGGLFVAGLAHSPRFLEETLAHGQGAALRAAAFLAPQEVADRPTAVWVNERLCSFCGLCVEACPFQARVMNYDTRVADVDYALCQGCGVCAMVCPNKATLQRSLEHGQFLAAIDAAMLL